MYAPVELLAIPYNAKIPLGVIPLFTDFVSALGNVPKSTTFLYLVYVVPPTVIVPISSGVPIVPPPPNTVQVLKP